MCKKCNKVKCTCSSKCKTCNKGKCTCSPKKAIAKKAAPKRGNK